MLDTGMTLALVFSGAALAFHDSGDRVGAVLCSSIALVWGIMDFFNAVIMSMRPTGNIDDDTMGGLAFATGLFLIPLSILHLAVTFAEM